MRNFMKVILFFGTLVIMLSSCNNNKVNEDVFKDEASLILSVENLGGKVFSDKKKAPKLISENEANIHFLEFDNDGILSMYFFFEPTPDKMKYYYDDKTGHLRYFDDSLSTFYVAKEDSYKFIYYKKSYFLVFLNSSFNFFTTNSESLFTTWKSDNSQEIYEIEFAPTGKVKEITTKDNSKTERTGSFFNNDGIITINFDDGDITQYLYDGKELTYITQLYPSSLPINVRK